MAVDIFSGMQLDNRFLSVVLAKLDSFRDLASGWDGDGAPAIDPQIVVAARQLIADHADLIASPFYVFPTLEAGVQLEWFTEGGRRELESVMHFL